MEERGIKRGSEREGAREGGEERDRGRAERVLDEQSERKGGLQFTKQTPTTMLSLPTYNS